MGSALEQFHAPVQAWFSRQFDGPTEAQIAAWPVIADGRSALLLAPTGSGKTLSAFLWAIDRLMFSPEPPPKERLRVLYISPLKALGVDVEKNLRVPLKGIAETAPEGARDITIAIRSGDTPPSERARIARRPPDILITTPESLYLMLSSQAAEILRSVDTVIVDEIHALVPTKRGTHLFLSLERLEASRLSPNPMQRIGLSATQRPLDEIARLLGGGVVEGSNWRPRPVQIVDAKTPKSIALTVEVPVDDMAKLSEDEEGETFKPASIWPSIHPRLVELIKAHRSTMIFVNSRRLAERLAAAINEEAEEEIALAHHGSIAKDQRLAIEGSLKAGTLPAIVATSSLELGIDMGAVDLVIQMEAPYSIASGLQRIGRAGHDVGATSKGIIFPKFRADLLACAAVSRRILDGEVEETFYPRRPLDVLAQQVVSIVASEAAISVDALFAMVKGAAPYRDLSRRSFESVLDMLSGKYPSTDFADLKPRLTWDRRSGILEPRQGAKRTAIINGGTIPDRGLYGVFLADGSTNGRRVGELDEEMVFESRAGDVFLLGATSWRISEITHDRVYVMPAPGQPGRMPFWRGEGLGRPFEFGEAIGALTAAIVQKTVGVAELETLHRLDEKAANNLLRYIDDQIEATTVVPTDTSIVVERFHDEVGEVRVCVLSPFGSQVHGPWATAVSAVLADELGIEAQMLWSDDGMVFRLPETEALPDAELFFPDADTVESLLVRRLGGTSLFAARFRENAARALLLPRRYPGRRTPLWAQRKRSADLLAVAAEFGDFPMILETYRQCLRDVFDLPALVALLKRIRDKSISTHVADTRVPSPFASSLMFEYVASFIYDGDAPLAERRAQALTIDHEKLRELLGEADLRALFDEETIAEVQRRLQRLDPEIRVRQRDGLHDLLLRLGPLAAEEVHDRCHEGASEWLTELESAERIVAVEVSGVRRFAAIEDAAKLEAALGVTLRKALPRGLHQAGADPLSDLVMQFARTNIPFNLATIAGRLGVGEGTLSPVLDRLFSKARLVAGEFLPGGAGQEWASPEVLRVLRRRALARLRAEVEPVAPEVLGRFLPAWHGLDRPRGGLEGLLIAIECLQGAPLLVSVLESEILPARVRDYRPAMLDELCAAGEVVWRGRESVGASDGRVALYLTDSADRLSSAPGRVEAGAATEVHACLAERGALFFSDLCRYLSIFPATLRDALWSLVWCGVVSNDTFAPLRSLQGGAQAKSKRGTRSHFRSRRAALPGTEGRFSLVPAQVAEHTERQAAISRQLLDRHGILTRNAVQQEGVALGFSGVYPVLRALEDAGKVRRGYFVQELGAAQFAVPGAEARLRKLRTIEAPTTVVLAATDPANPYGAALPWPTEASGRMARAAGAQVVLGDGALWAYVGRTEKSLLTFLPDQDDAPARLVAALSARLVGRRRALLIETIDAQPARDSWLAAHFQQAGFAVQRRGLLKR